MEPFPRTSFLPPPRREEFVDPFNHRGWLEFFENLLPRFRYLRFVGLPSLKDLPDVPLERLYVPLELGPRYVAPGAAEERSERMDVGEALERFRHVVVLGDPGSGKSTLTSYLTTTFASRRSHSLRERMGPLIPLPFVLREFTIARDVTFDDLLEQFLAERYWSSKLTREDLLAALDRGQGLVLLDGLDEIGDVLRRKALRRAVLEEGLAKFPRSRWLLTSRIVGYEEVPFDLPSMPSERKTDGGQGRWLAVMKEEVELALIPERLHLLPFTLQQILRFANNWYALREADPAERQSGVESLLAAIRASPAIERLAHTPNLLQMMALIHRVYAQLPSGRALLYDRIAEAYLESIDDYRGIRESSVPASRQVAWLGRLAYGLQRQRAQDGADASEILVPGELVEQEIHRSLGAEVDATRELSYIARRSGLLLPKKPGFFSFVHLSFQEYFAACHLYDQLMGFDSRKEAQRAVAKLAKQPIWHETLVFLFEKLSRHQGASDWLFQHLFRKGRTASGEELLLAVDLLGDLHAGLSPESLCRGARLVIGQGLEVYRQPLLARLNALSDSVWEEYLQPAVEHRLAEGPPLKPESLLFLTKLDPLAWDRLEALASAGPLAKIRDQEPQLPGVLHWWLDEAASQAKEAEVPLWLDSHPPMQNFWGREVPSSSWDRAALVRWIAACDLRITAILVKMTVRALGSPRPSPALAWAPVRAMERNVGRVQTRAELARALERDRKLAEEHGWALALTRARERSWALDWARERERALTQKRDPNRDRDRDLARVLAQDLARALALAVARGQGQDRNLAQALEQALALARLLNRDLTWAVDRDLTGDRNHGEISGVRAGSDLRLLTALLSGEDSFAPARRKPRTPDAHPGLLILYHLERLLLGRGGSEDWRQIEEQVDLLADPAWVQEHLPFLRPGEMADALRLLGLRMEDGKALFEAEWFEASHPLAPALNARPSEFIRAVKKLARGEG